MRAFQAHIVHSVNMEILEIIKDGFLLLDDQGKLEGVTKELPESYTKVEVEHFKNCLILPGLIDTHAHIPQYAFSGIGEKELLPWLEKYTFPHEARFSNNRIAQTEINNFFEEMLRFGTTTMVAYSTMHTEATDIAFEVAKQKGIRAFLGKVLMNQNSPDALTENTEEAIKGCEQLIKKWHGKYNLEFMVTPRFAISCDQGSLQAAARLAQEHDLYIQTHLSENKAEVKAALSLHPYAKSYTDIYHQNQLVTNKTLLAHCIHLEQNEINLIKKQGAIISHCATSNRFLASGIMPLRRYLDEGLNVTIGTDVAAGYSLSMMNECKEVLETSKLYQYLNQTEPLKFSEVLYLATLGAAERLGIGAKTGNFAKGKEADFIVVDSSFSTALQTSQYKSAEELLSQVIYRNHPDMVSRTYINANLVFEKN